MAVVIPVLLIMVAYRVWVLTGPRRAQPIAGPLTALLLLLLSGSPPAEVGLTLTGGAYAVSAVASVAAGYGLAWLIPAGRRALATGRRYPRPVLAALVGVPLSTVIFEEVAFRGVLWTVLADAHGPGWATAITALLFGIWHFSPEAGFRRSLGPVAFTTVAGVLLALLRHLSGGLLAPVLLHWTANGLGILATAAITRPGRDASGERRNGR
ncbi:CPBP family intramembrane glutamic endopeptidase [Actinoplanes sp. NBRC 101535]|uniref:CPBP family intramembrane glutamic endopeptidase n=1 Tax=Actinoplanes sp. NBRC 101535 TaxID=3032196 RepID=UPI0025522042|nr:CPBP family intramembrane glutamic endopeptidase [Actinoplanes sp. NBRC 101535]